MWNEIIETITNYIIRSFGLDKLDTPQGVLLCICMCVNLFFVLTCLYRFFYILIGLFGKSPKYPVAPKDKKYAFVIAAKNEEGVIANLIDSIHKQDYPSNLITIFVIADNCDPGDKTAEICRNMGCIVYERHDLKKQRKGYALGYIFEKIKEDYGIRTFDGYLFCDADNVLNHDYLSRMHDALASQKAKVFTAYCASKNFKDGFIASSHSIYGYRGILCNHRPRAALGKGTSMCGKGVIFDSEVLENGWPYHELCEDTEFTFDYICKNERILFVEEAVYYDEQPNKLKISFRQRLRWAKGSLFAFIHQVPKIVPSFIKKPTWEKYDMWWDVFPYGLITTVMFFLYNIISLIMYFCGTPGYDWWSFASYFVNTIVGVYVGTVAQGILVLIKERKNIHCPMIKQIIFLFYWGLFDMLTAPLTIISLFMHVTWKPVPHESHVTMEELENDDDDNDGKPLIKKKEDA